MLTALELEYKREFKVVAADISSAVESADDYGKILVDFRLVRRYFLLILNEVVICFPTDNEESDMTKFLEHYNKGNE
jgi:hypothetical protein